MDRRIQLRALVAEAEIDYGRPLSPRRDIVEGTNRGGDLRRLAVAAIRFRDFETGLRRNAERGAGGQARRVRAVPLHAVGGTRSGIAARWRVVGRLGTDPAEVAEVNRPSAEFDVIDRRAGIDHVNRDALA